MRFLFALPVVAMVAAPAAAQPPRPESRERIEIPAELSSPETAEKLGRMMGALSKAFMDLKVGEVVAAAEGREATPAEKQRTVRDIAGKGDPNFERDVQQQVEQAGPMLQQSMKALTAALPAIVRSMEGLGDELERATANLPQPGYPKR